MNSVTVGVLGLGEAGSAFAAGMVAHGAEVRGFDPADVTVPAGVTGCMTAAQAV
jgi:phosphoglycerate dehydrogenase-like enzyme